MSYKQNKLKEQLMLLQAVDEVRYQMSRLAQVSLLQQEEAAKRLFTLYSLLEIPTLIEVISTSISESEDS